MILWCSTNRHYKQIGASAHVCNALQNVLQAVVFYHFGYCSIIAVMHAGCITAMAELTTAIK